MNKNLVLSSKKHIFKKYLLNIKICRKQVNKSNFWNALKSFY